MRTVQELDMGSPFDLFSDISSPNSDRVTAKQYKNRILLQDIMKRNGFLPFDDEWWHFTLNGETYPDTYFNFPVSSKYLNR